MGYSRKNPNRGIWSFRGIKEIECGNFQGLFKNEVEFPGDQEKIMWNFQGSLFLALEFPRNLTQFCGICIGWLSVFCLEFSGGVKQKMKNPREDSKTYILTPCALVWIFSGIAQYCVTSVS